MCVIEEFQTLQFLGGVTDCHSVFVLSYIFKHVAEDYVVKKKPKNLTNLDNKRY